METKPPMHGKLTDARVMDRLREIVKTGIDPGTGLSVDSRTQWNARGLLEETGGKRSEHNVFYKYVKDDLPGLGKDPAREKE